MSQHRPREKTLGLAELIAIALGGMVGGGIFTVLGISVSMIGFLTPFAIIIGGIIAAMAAYSYVKLGLYYRDQGATYSFYKKTYPKSKTAISAIGWFVIFGYISTLALYAYTFASYALSSTTFAENLWLRKGVTVGIIALFTLINVWSVNGMGKLEDIMVYTKLVLLTIISVVLMQNSTMDFSTFTQNLSTDIHQTPILSVLIVASITFVAYEGFQLVINAVDEMENPEKNIPRAIYTAIFLAVLIYVIISMGATLAIPFSEIIENKEFALAAGAEKAIGKVGAFLVIAGALLATSSAISGTVFGASRQMAVIAKDGYFPAKLAERKNGVPVNGIITMALFASLLVLVGGLELILEFGSITFLLVSLLMAIANYKIRDKTNSSNVLTLTSIVGLSIGAVLILYYEFTTAWEEMLVIIGLYVLLGIGAWIFAKRNK